MPFKWLFEEGQQADACIDQFGYEEWLQFVFDHPAPKKDEERWYNLESAEIFYFKDSQLFLNRLTQLFLEPEQLLSRYSTEQIKQGFWCFITAFELNDLLEDKDLDFEVRQRCIESLEVLYRRLFRRSGYEKIAFMYWDPLTYTFWNHLGRPDDMDLIKVQDSMFQCLVRILQHRERINFLAAARGLGHLRHEKSSKVIYEILMRRSDIFDEDRAYALSCTRGEADFRPGPRLV